jgi:diguanylate cyclase (GGDEF)-like protein
MDGEPLPLPLPRQGSQLARALDALLTTDVHQRIRLKQCGRATLLTLASCVSMAYAVATGDAPLAPTSLIIVIAALGFTGFFATIRMGANRRFGDPSLTQPQMLFAIACAAVAYALIGALRGGVFPILMVVLSFGMFALRPRQMTRVTLFALAAFGAAMILMARRRPDVYLPAIEIGHFFMLAVMMPALSLLAGELSRLRARLHRQKRELSKALLKIQDLAIRDELTGLINRRQMLELMAQEHQRCMRTGRPFCIAMLDLDYFKEVNDRHGHAAGDAVLQAFANAVQGSIRIGDIVARWGGEEFVLMLADTALPAAQGGVERVRECVQALRVAVPGPRGPTEVGVTVSIGLTDHRSGETVAQLLERADLALYRAKSQGRNQLVTV